MFIYISIYIYIYYIYILYTCLMGFGDSQFWDNLFQQCEGSSLNLIEPHSQGVQGCSRNVKDTLSCQATWESVVTSNLFTISWAIMTNIYKHCVASWRQQSLGFCIRQLHAFHGSPSPHPTCQVSRCRLGHLSMIFTKRFLTDSAQWENNSNGVSSFGSTIDGED